MKAPSLLTEEIDFWLNRKVPVIPIHSLERGRCSCGSVACQSPGKHPLTKNGLKDASIEPVQIYEWLEKFHIFNLAIRTGVPSGILVLDFDLKSGGLGTFDQIQSKYGEFPPCPVVRTGGGGKHLYFKSPKEGFPNFVGLLPGMDVRGDGGYVLTPPSQHSSGRCYEWEQKISLDAMSEPPDWLFELRNEKKVKVPMYRKLLDTNVLEGSRNSMLTSLVGSLISSRLNLSLVPLIAHSVNRTNFTPPLSTQEVDQIIDSVCRSEIKKEGRHG